MSMRYYCDNCDRDISDDANLVQIRLQAKLSMLKETDKTKWPLPDKDIDLCIMCAKSLLGDALLRKLFGEQEREEK